MTTHWTSRTSINPVIWSIPLGFNQGELVTHPTRTLYLSGQTAMSAGGRPQHEGDIAAQLTLSLDNVEAVLVEADMTWAHLVRLNVYTTDVDALFEHYGSGADHHHARGLAAGRPRSAGRAGGHGGGLDYARTT